MEKVIITVKNAGKILHQQTFDISYGNIQRGDIVNGFRDFKYIYVLYCIERKHNLSEKTLYITCTSLPFDANLSKLSVS